MIVNIEVTGAGTLPDDIDVQQLAEQVFDEGARLTGAPADAMVDVLLCDEQTIHSINRQYRAIDRATDVLSFPNIEMGGPGLWPASWPVDALDPEGDHPVLGNIALCKQYALAQAEAYGHSPRREVAFLLAHSFLHLCGYDHETDEESAVMEEMQESILSRLGITRS